jgi:hypothetical protein
MPIVYVVFCFEEGPHDAYAIDVFDSVYLNKDEAEARASDLWGGSVREVRVSGHLKGTKGIGILR